MKTSFIQPFFSGNITIICIALHISSYFILRSFSIVTIFCNYNDNLQFSNYLNWALRRCLFWITIKFQIKQFCPLVYDYHVLTAWLFEITTFLNTEYHFVSFSVLASETLHLVKKLFQKNQKRTLVFLRKR